MDFSFNINELFKEEITCVDGSLQLCQSETMTSLTREGIHQLQQKLSTVVDQMGEASAKAQGLDNPITTGTKLKGSDHRLYILKDSSGSRGCIVGILKVGRKNLFLYDKCKVQHEVQPLCVLDFYVHESRQRMGCGRRLFDFMLQREGIPVQHFAINRPSPKFLSFLAKHYKMQVAIPQVYNFVIFDGFFDNREGNNQNRRSGENANIDNSTRFSKQNLNSGRRYYNSQKTEDEAAWNVLNNWISPNSGRQNERHMRAGQMMYSRHGVMAGVQDHDRPNSTTNRFRQDPSSINSNIYRNQTNTYSSNNSVYDSGPPTAQKYLDQDIRPPAQLKQTPELNPPLLQRDGPPVNYSDMLNLHQRYQQRNGHLTIPSGTTAISLPGPLASQSAHVPSAHVPSAGQSSSIILQPITKQYILDCNKCLTEPNTEYIGASWRLQQSSVVVMGILL
ncbi:unnamed protein product [Candidula unifasciata]|uniref:Alpha-tubulin N-acetyltransferase n=1 Tax=Candidula unifasciata TaxID=100452 RepID=A0A8S3ZMN5_9EUPU|nr:unnamed protein product [Candidula unifasciata]